jgi:uncharacterized membrane protein YbhN (UPF0104 family)
VLHSTGHAIAVFSDHLAAVRWHWLASAVACHLCKLVVASRAWRNIVTAAYPTQPVRWRAMFAAYVAGAGVNAIIPARGGDAVKLFIRRPGSSCSSHCCSSAGCSRLGSPSA